MTKIMTVDPAISEAKTADYTAIVVSGLDIFGNIFVLDIVRKRMSPSEIIETIFELQSQWHVNQIGIERFEMKLHLHDGLLIRKMSDLLTVIP